MSGPDVEGLPSYFRDNPWVEILANRGQEDVADMVPLAPGASGNSAISTAEPAQVSPSPKSSQPSQAPSSQELRQLISSLTRLIQGQDQVAHAQASAQSQPMIMVIPVVIQVPMPYPWPVQAQGYEIGGHGGVLCTPRYVEERSAKPLARRPPGFKSRRARHLRCPKALILPISRCEGWLLSGGGACGRGAGMCGSWCSSPSRWV